MAWCIGLGIPAGKHDGLRCQSLNDGFLPLLEGCGVACGGTSGRSRPVELDFNRSTFLAFHRARLQQVPFTQRCIGVKALQLDFFLTDSGGGHFARKGIDVQIEPRSLVGCLEIDVQFVRENER